MRSATTVFWLRVTIPVNQELKVKEIVNPRMTFKVNGKAVELQPNDGQSSTFPSEAYFAVEPLIPGDKLEFHAEAEGFEPISAQTVIPQEIKDLTLSASMIPGPNPDYYVAALDDRASQAPYRRTNAYLLRVGYFVYKVNITIFTKNNDV